MKYTVEYLLKQLEETRAIHDRYVNALEADSSNVAAKIMVRSMSGHIAEIEQDLRDARQAESRFSGRSKEFVPKAVSVFVTKQRKADNKKKADTGKKVLVLGH